jgi:hypothetical protein
MLEKRKLEDYTGLNDVEKLDFRREVTVQMLVSLTSKCTENKKNLERVNLERSFGIISCKKEQKHATEARER